MRNTSLLDGFQPTGIFPDTLPAVCRDSPLTNAPSAVAPSPNSAFTIFDCNSDTAADCWSLLPSASAGRRRICDAAVGGAARQSLRQRLQPALTFVRFGSAAAAAPVFVLPEYRHLDYCIYACTKCSGVLYRPAKRGSRFVAAPVMRLHPVASGRRILHGCLPSMSSGDCFRRGNASRIHTCLLPRHANA